MSMQGHAWVLTLVSTCMAFGRQGPETKVENYEDVALQKLTGLAETAHWQKALLLLGSVKSPGLPAICSRLLSRLARQSHWHQAQSFFQTLPQKGITLTPGIYSAFLSCFAKKSLWQAALHLLKSAESGNSGELFAKELDTPVYNTVITSCSRASKWPWSIVLLEQLISHQNSFRKANLYSFNATLSACERRGLWTHGCALLQQMQENQVTPDSASLNCLLSACEKGQEWQKALTFLSHFSSDRPMTLVTYGAIVANCVVGSAWEGALNSLLEAMSSNLRPSAELFNSLTECCRKSWAWRHCLWLMEMNLSQSKIQWLATLHAIEQAQQVQMKIELRHGIHCSGVQTDPTVLKHIEISVEKFEWTGRHPTVVGSTDWLQKANDLAGTFVRHSLECRSGFAERMASVPEK